MGTGVFALVCIGSFKLWVLSTFASNPDFHALYCSEVNTARRVVLSAEGSTGAGLAARNCTLGRSSSLGCPLGFAMVSFPASGLLGTYPAGAVHLLSALF